MEVHVSILNAFTMGGSGGNAAGVVMDAAHLTEAQKQEIAARVALSETAFILPCAEADVEIRFFTPVSEIEFCGHATVASFALLRQSGMLRRSTLTQKTKAGKLGVRVFDDGLVMMDQALPEFRSTLEPQPLARILGLAEQDVSVVGLPIQIVSTGLADILVPVANDEALSRIQPNFAALAEFSRAHQCVGAHVFTFDVDDPRIAARCRNFAPLYGIDEESATGSSSGALACYLSRHAGGGDDRYLFEQGRQMGQPSLLSAEVTMEKGQVVRIQVGGHAVLGETRTVVL